MLTSLITATLLAVSPVTYVTDRIAPIYQAIETKLFHHSRRINKSNTTDSTTTGSTSASNSLSSLPANSAYPVHKDTAATVFWAGEAAGVDNGFITNVESAWMDDWVKAFGGIDDPLSRSGFLPKNFIPKENPFYFALPFSDYGSNGPKSDLSMVPWSNGKLLDGQSILKNHWIAVEHNGKTAYAQWEDVGPYFENDSAYVFGTASPKYKGSGLDISPATADYLGFHDTGKVNWRFVDDSQVPDGAWKKMVTVSAPSWQ